MRNWLGKLQSLFSNPRFLALLILIVTAVALKVFLWLIYTKDQPNFVPEETREDIRGSIKEGIARPLEISLPVIGKPMLESAFIKSSEKSGNTENWQTYKNEELGIELKYPEGWVVNNSKTRVNDYLGTIEFIDQKGVLAFDLDYFDNSGLKSSSEVWLADSSKMGEVGEGVPLVIAGRTFLRADESGDPDHAIYVYSTPRYHYKFKTLFENETKLRGSLEHFQPI